MEQPTPVPFDPAALHHQRPKLRMVRGFPAQVGDQQALGLADAKQISDRVLFTAPAVQVVLPLMDGNRDVDQIVSEVGRGLTRAMLEELISQLDGAGLLFGPRFEAIAAEVRAAFDAASALPPTATMPFYEALARHELKDGYAQADPAARAQAAAKGLTGQFDAWIAQALAGVEKPSFDELPAAIVAPHVDYPRGWINYAGVYGRLRVVDRPDRVIILGTNHFGDASGVCAAAKGYETILGACPLDEAVADGLRQRLGETLFEHRFDLRREHSVELQIPWIQHCLGRDEKGSFCPVFGALVHDPAPANGESYDGRGVSLASFVKAMQETIASLPGRTLIIASADLSHAGPAFGDPQPMVGQDVAAKQRQEKVIGHDREMLRLLCDKKVGELVAAMAWQQNPTRWCSTGNLVAAVQIAEPAKVELLNYVAAIDKEGLAMVSCASMVMKKNART